MARNDGEFLKQRADRFRELGGRLLDEETYDLAAFHLQQAAELLLKYRLFLQLGDYPRTHSLKQLIEQYGTATGRREEAEEFLDEHIDVVSNVGNAYMTSRYLPGEFRRSEIENMNRWLDALDEFVEAE